MDKRTFLSVSALFVASLTLCLPALAAEPGPSAQGDQKLERPAPKKEIHPLAPRAAAAEDPYRCHPTEDISCTVVRETAQGTLIVTVRPKGQPGPGPAWIVINGAPPTAGPHAGGTVYVVPNSAADKEPRPQVAVLPSNGAPILE